MALDTKNEIRNLVIYQIFTRNYKDGTFKAVERDLPRIQALGVDYIYLLPIQPSGKVHRKGSMGSPYAIQDYRAIDPVQGTMEDFIHLTEKAHELGLKVMLDVVYNHTSPDSVLSQEHPEWFYHKKDGSFGNHIGDWWDVIDLDYTNKDLWTYQIDTLKMWAKYVDGFRCDVASLVPLPFWLEARAAVEEVRPGCIWLAESVEPIFITITRKLGLDTYSDGELYQAFDILYDYDIAPEWSSMLNGEHTLADYLSAVMNQENIYPRNYSKLRCLENHDRPRAAARFVDDAVLRNWTAWSYFQKGTTMIYAGQEVCATHHPTLFDLDTVDFETGKDLSGLFAQLSELKKDPIFADGIFSCEAIGAGKDIILARWERRDEDGNFKPVYIGVFSTTGKKESLYIDLPDGTYQNVISGDSLDVFEKTAVYSGEPVILHMEE